MCVTMSAAKKAVIDRIEPTDWYVGLKSPQVQLMVYGQGIRDVENVSTDYPGVRIDSLVRLDSPNYLLIYMAPASKTSARVHRLLSGVSTMSTEYRLVMVWL